MMMIVVAILAVFFALIVYFVMIYNNLVTLKNNVLRNWSNIDVLLKQRYSELPKLIDTCKVYMQYEQSTFEKIVEARKAAVSATDKKDMLALGQATSIMGFGQ